MKTQQFFKHILALYSILLLAVACQGPGSGSASSQSYVVGGVVTGLSGTLTLQNNLSDELVITNNGVFVFATKVSNTTAYSVTVKTPPAGQTCDVSNSTGQVNDADVTNLHVSCSTITHTVGGTVSGLTGGTLILQNNGGSNLAVNSNGSFVFQSPLAPGVSYSVAVLTQPNNQICGVLNGSGTVGASNVTNISVSCITLYKIFVTAQTVNGNVGGVLAADNACLSDTNYPGTGAYKALIVDGSSRVACTSSRCSTLGAVENVDWALAPNRTYVRTTDGEVIGTTNASGIFDFPITRQIGASSFFIWTGLDANWTVRSTCLAWTTNSSSDSGYVGNSGSVNQFVIGGTNSACDFTINHLYCVEQ